MADQIKPRYRLGCQFHLDLAKDDATKIPERTLFRISTTAWCRSYAGEIGVRDESDRDGTSHSVWFVIGPNKLLDGYFVDATDLQPLI